MIAALPPRLRPAVSPYTGIVRSVEELLRGTAEPPFFEASCGVAVSGELVGSPLDHLSGIGGAGRTRADAAAAAVGEALERYSATYVPRERFVVATARELARSAVQPEEFGLFSDRQLRRRGFPFRRFTADTRIAWVEGLELPAGRPVYVPAELVYLGDARATASAPIGYATSSGLACAEDPLSASLRAALELLERDAFSIVWANRLSLPLLEPPEGLLEGAGFARPGLPFSAVDLSVVHGVPTVLGVVRAPGGIAGALGVGAAAAASAERAWWKALAEAFASRAAGATLALLRADRPLGRRGRRVVTFEDHIRFYADRENAALAGFLDASPQRVPLADVAPLEGETRERRLEAVCRRIAAAGSRACAVEVTSPDVAALGLAVVRVVAPGLCPLEASHAARFLGGRRLYEAAAALGLADRPLRACDLNPDPHPFP